MQSNIDGVMAQFSALSDGIRDKATLRAINRAVDAVATQANREIRKVYRIKARDIAKAINKKRAHRGQAVLRGEVTFKGRRLNLYDFAARQTKRGASVQVLVNGPRKVLPGTFIATNSHTGFRGLFRRVGKARYPIVNLRAIAIPQTVTNKQVSEAIRAVANETFIKNFRQQLQYLGQK